ncbi:hypothetical protein EOL08_21890, partial [Klebsiella pneumoniae]
AACRDKSKVPRSGDFAGRSPGVQGAAATGRPLCAPCAIRNITQKINGHFRLCRHFAGWRQLLTRPGVREACHSFTHLRD